MPAAGSGGQRGQPGQAGVTAPFAAGPRGAIMAGMLPSLRALRSSLPLLSLPLLLSALQPAARAQEERFDLVLRGGTVVDGSGGAPFAADVGIRGGRIAALGHLRGLAAADEIDCRGLVVAPGFIDVHAHVDATVARHPGCDNYLRMGVTTLITGNCGSSVRDLDAHFGRLEKGGIGANYGSLVGLGTVRREVLGSEDRAPDERELARMGALVEAGMQAGAFGVSTGLIYVPGTYASTGEITALARVAAAHGGLYATHMRNENDRVLEAIDEALQIGRDAGLPVHISHIKCSGRPNWGRSTEVLTHLLAARLAGQRVTADQYAYDASSTGIDVLFPAAELAVGREEFGRRLREDAAFRGRMKEALFATMDKAGFGDLGYARIASAAGSPDLSGLTIREAARLRLGRDDRDAQAELAMDVFAAAAPRRVSMVYHSMGAEDVARFMAQDWIAVAADGGLRLETGNEKPHPRSCGNNPRVLARFVRELGVLDLPAAVHKMSALPARVFGIEDRGAIRPGAFADLVVFDADTVADRATFTDPLLPPDGIHRVLVNGHVAVADNVVAAGRHGHVLRRRPRER